MIWQGLMYALTLESYPSRLLPNIFRALALAFTYMLNKPPSMSMQTASLGIIGVQDAHTHA